MKTLNTLAALLASILLVACGGGGGGDAQLTANSPPPPPPPPTAGIGRTGVAVGPIDTFGSIVVNGVRYDTDTAAFTIDDSSGSQSDLAVGDVVTVLGTIDDGGVTGTADTVIFDDAVTGPVGSVDVVANSLMVLGQAVLVTPQTSFDDSFAPASIEGVSPGDIVEVSGQIDANGNIVATRLEPKPAGTQFEVHGIVSSLDAGTMRFNIGSLVVDYAAATLDDFPGGQVSDGDFVEAKGATFGGAGELLATSVELESLIPNVEDGDNAEIEGFITRFVSASDFDVAGFPVTTTTATVFVGGSATDLGLNLKVEVEGTVNASGVLVASEVDIRRATAVRATSLLDSVDAAASSVELLGITVNIDVQTRLEDKSNAELEPLTVADLNAGDYVEVRGDEFPAGSGNILASIFEREDPDTETILQGFVQSIAEPAFEILGVTIQTNGATVFRDENELVISSVEFFNRLTAGSLVKADGTEVSAMTILAEEVEFED